MCLIIILTIAISVLYLLIRDNQVFAIEINRNSVISGEFEKQIRTLTSKEEKIAYLTFDDGPNKVVTPVVLDILKKENVKATFFVIGKNVEEHPEIVKRGYEEGHYMANHGYSHDNKKLYKSDNDFLEEVRKTDKAIGKAIGDEEYCSYVFRFPNGYIAKQNKREKERAVKLLSNMDYSYIDWNCLNNDSMKKYSNKQLLENLKKTSKNKGTLVVLMHDTKDVSNSSLVLEDSIKYLKSQGYTFHNFYDLIEEAGNKQ
ncbi:MAG: polysaccharide deacetylase [Clostridia bacterium]|nr:polysaccharide deacetylase [Clostridia bacterium]